MKKVILSAAIACLVSCTQQSVAPQPPTPPPSPTTVGTPPIIHIYGPTVFYHRLDSAFVGPIPFGFDNEDGDISSLVVTNSTVDIHTIGSYPVYYSLMDSDSNLVHDSIIVNIDTGFVLLYGPYNVTHDSCELRPNSPSLGMFADVQFDPSVNGGIIIGGFGAYEFDVNIYGVVNGNTITFAPNQPMAQFGTLLSATGTITSLDHPAFDISYTWTDGVNIHSGTCHYTHR